MSAPLWNIILEEGGDFDLNIVWKLETGAVVDVTGYGAKLTVQNEYDSPVLLTASVANSRIVIAGTTGEFTINIPAVSVSAVKHLIGPDAGYTLIIWPSLASSDVNPKRLVQGCVTLSRDYA